MQRILLRNKLNHILYFSILNLEFIEHSTPESWTVEQVTQWLSFIGLKELIQAFRGNFYLVSFNENLSIDASDL